MRQPRRFITFANVASLLALVFSMAGGAVAARHYLISSTSQISPKVLKKLKGATGEIGPVGPQGVTGATGPKGSTGGRGEPYPQVLIAGATESGDFGVRGTGTPAQTITFRVPLSAAIPAAQVEFLKPGLSGPNCKGIGQAAKGYLCLYATTETEVGTPKVFSPESPARSAGTGLLGFTLELSGAGAAGAYEGIFTATGS